MNALAPARLGIADVKPQLQARAGELVALLCPGARREGDHWVAPNPRRGEDYGGSFIVWKNLAWKEYDAGEDEKGDAIDLLIYTGQAKDRSEALAWAKQWLGLSDVAAPEIVRLRAEASKRREKQQADELAQADSMRRWAKRVFLEADELAPGTPAWIYLEDCRRIPMARLKAMGTLNALRCSPRMKYTWPAAAETPDAWKARRPRDGASFYPALVAAMTQVNGGADFAVHRTYVERDGLSKAPVIKAKKMAGDQLGCAIKLWRGETGLSDRDAVKRGKLGPLGVSEGIETGLSVVAGLPEMRHWSMGSLASICAMPWPKCASELVIFADHPKDGRAGDPARNAIANASWRLAQFGKVRVAYSPVGKDFNDLIRSEGAGRAK